MSEYRLYIDRGIPFDKVKGIPYMDGGGGITGIVVLQRQAVDYAGSTLTSTWEDVPLVFGDKDE